MFPKYSSNTSVLLYKQYKTLLDFLTLRIVPAGPGKEIQPFRLTLVPYRLTTLGFRKRNRRILSERNVGTERMLIFERLTLASAGGGGWCNPPMSFSGMAAEPLGGSR